MEVWLDIPDQNGYQASSLGRVRSFWGKGSHGPTLNTPIVLRTKMAGPYLAVNLRNVSHRIHVLVAATFIGPRPDRMQVCHNNGNQLDNAVGNLRYDTAVSNALDAAKHDKIKRGSARKSAVLDEATVAIIKRQILNGERVCDIAEEHGRPESTIQNIRRDTHWRHVKPWAD